MNYKYPSIALLGVVLLLSGCGEPDRSPTLPGPVQVSGGEFISADQYQFVPGSVLETTSLSLDYINPRFDQGIPVRSTPLQGSGDARIRNVEARLLPAGEIPTTNNVVINASQNASTLAIQFANTNPLAELQAFGPSDNRLTAQFPIGGLVAVASNANDQRIRVNTTFRSVLIDEEDDNRLISNLSLTVRRILVSPDGSQVVLEGDTSLIVRTLGVLYEDPGPGPDGEILTAGSLINPDDEGVSAIMQNGRFSASFRVQRRGVAGDGSTEDPLSLFARLNFVPNQAELVYRPTQVGTTSVLFAPNPQRANILPNQLVQVRRLLNGRVQAEFDPANVSTVLNFTQVPTSSNPFPTPVPILPVPSPTPLGPTAFDYFFSLRTERAGGTAINPDLVEGVTSQPVVLQGVIPTTGDFIFRSLAGSQLAGPFNRFDIGGAAQRGSLTLVFDQSINADHLRGDFFLEQEFPTDNIEVGPEPNEASILIIRGTFSGSEVRL